MTLLIATSLARAQDSPIGFYIGEPTPSSAKSTYDAFVKAVRHQPASTSLFIDYREPIWSAGTYDPKWRNNANWAAGELARLVSSEFLDRVDEQGHSTFIPVVAVGLTDDPTVFGLNLPADHPEYGKYNEAAAIAMMNDVAAGKYDIDDPSTARYRVWPAILEAFKNKGFKQLYLRIGWEQNGNWYGWRVRSEATKIAYIAAWRHVADLAHRYAAEHGMSIRTVWSPSASFSNYGVPEEESYPGDAHVDVIAPTAYSPIWNPTRSQDRSSYYDWSTQQDVSLATWLSSIANRRKIWDYPSADYWNPTRGWGIPAAIAFAQSRSKPFGLSETGTGNAGVTTRGGGPVDDGDYPLYLAQRLSPALAQGLQLELIEIWAEGSGSDGKNFLSGSRPLEAAAWKEFVAITHAAQRLRNVAATRPAYASSVASSTNSAAKIADGNLSTFWKSATSPEKQWIYVDLGQRYTVSRLRLDWGAGYASHYQIQTLISGTNWTNIYATANGDGGIDEIVGLAGLGRHVRVFATRRGAGASNYELKEMEVYP
jgi:hypothetical protein